MIVLNAELKSKNSVLMYESLVSLVALKKRAETAVLLHSETLQWELLKLYALNIFKEVRSTEALVVLR